MHDCFFRCILSVAVSWFWRQKLKSIIRDLWHLYLKVKALNMSFIWQQNNYINFSFLNIKIWQRLKIHNIVQIIIKCYCCNKQFETNRWQTTKTQKTKNFSIHDRCWHKLLNYLACAFNKTIEKKQIKKKKKTLHPNNKINKNKNKPQISKSKH